MMSLSLFIQSPRRLEGDELALLLYLKYDFAVVRIACRVPISTPIRRTRSPCCARAESGHAAAPPRSVMNLRRFMSSIGDFLPYELSQPPTGPCAQSSTGSACRRAAGKSLGQS